MIRIENVSKDLGEFKLDGATLQIGRLQASTARIAAECF